jgi:hypothetical protein
MHGQHVVRRERGCTERVNSSLGAERERAERDEKNNNQQYASITIAKAVGCRIMGLLARRERLGGEERGPREKACRPRE